MKLSIVKYPNPILTTKTKKVKDPLDLEIQKLIPGMISLMRTSNGMGLAANQAGKSIRLCIIEDKEEEKMYVLINPTITTVSKTKIVMEEGCLSFPGEFFPISRPEKVQVRYLDETGKSAKIKVAGLLARALQHEIDHLDGIVFIERIKKSKKK